MKKIFPLILLIFLFSFLLIFPSQTLAASKTGLLLWFDTLVPTLLPFLIVSQLILKTPLADYIQRLLGPLFRRLFHCSEKGAFCLLCGFLCGYPVGARLISLQIRENQFSPKEGQYLLGFCNNVSPMFCISYGITEAIGSSKIFTYLFIIYGSALLFGLLTRPSRDRQTVLDEKKLLSEGFSETKKQTSEAETFFQLIDVCIIDSFLILIKLCGYLILFSIISCSIQMILPMESPKITSAVAAFLELTGGLSLVSRLPKGICRSVIGIFALTFGGLCCIFQTNSVISNTGLSLKKYILHKLLITLLALLLFVLYIEFVNIEITNIRQLLFQ